MRRLFFIFTFLCAAFSVSAQQQSGRLQAALCERQAYYAESPAEQNAALMQKARWLECEGDCRHALSTLERVRLFALTPSQRDSIGIRKAYLAFLMEDYDRSLSYLEEIAQAPDWQSPKLKNEWVAMALTFLVPAGFIYVDAPGQGALYTALNALAIGGIVLQISSGCYVSGILGGALALNVTYLGAQEKVALLVQKRNSQIIRQSRKDSLSSFFQASSEGRTERPE
jgi:hypothetical protein